MTVRSTTTRSDAEGPDAIETTALVCEVDGVVRGTARLEPEPGGRSVCLTLELPHGSSGQTASELLDSAVVWAASSTRALQVETALVPDGPDTATLGRCGFRLQVPTLPGEEPTYVRTLAGRVRVGVHSGQQYARSDDVVALWQRAEALDYDWVSLFDHYRPPMGGPDGYCLDGPTLLAAVAATTRRVRCGFMVTAPQWRHPALLAAAAMTVDQVSGGRLELGVGVGGPDLAFSQYGIEQPDLGTRFEHLDETCQALRLLWSGGPVGFAGRHIRLTGAHLQPRPLQRRVPLVVGGAGPERTLPLVARHADVWNTALLPTDLYARRCARLDELLATLGRDPYDVRRSMTFRAVLTDDRDRAKASSSRLAAEGRAADAGEYAAFGSAQQCVDALAPYVHLGVRDFVLGLRPPLDHNTMERFVTEVAPSLRAEAA